MSDLYVWVKVLTVSYQLCELTCEPYTRKNGENICITVIFFVLVSSFFPPMQTHTAVFYLPGSSSKWWYIVNFNTQILDILYGCELLSNSNWRLASGRFSFRTAGHCRRRSSSNPFPHIQAIIDLSTCRKSIFHSLAQVQLPDWTPLETRTPGLELHQHILLCMTGLAVARSMLLNVKGMLIKRCNKPTQGWNQDAKI